MMSSRYALLAKTDGVSVFQLIPNEEDEQLPLPEGKTDHIDVVILRNSSQETIYQFGTSYGILTVTKADLPLLEKAIGIVKKLWT